MLNIKQIKSDFPIFSNDPSLVYLDSTATSLKPLTLMEKINEYYKKYSANVFRGVYKISEKATQEYEDSREVVAKFINANRTEEVIFTRNTTESINLVAYSLGRLIIEENDEIVATVMDHHSNFVPWQVLAAENGAIFKVIDVTDEGELDIQIKDIKYKSSNGDDSSRDNIGHGVNLINVITKKTKILALPYISNVLGTINRIKEIATEAKKINPNIIIVVDAAQAVPHKKIDVQEMGADFIAFSSHKMLGPTGIGVLWGKYDLLDKMTPFQYGGEMISKVSIPATTFKEPPHKFEAGTPHIAGVIALKEAINYLKQIGMLDIREHEKKITQYAMTELKKEFGERINMISTQDVKRR